MICLLQESRRVIVFLSLSTTVAVAKSRMSREDAKHKKYFMAFRMAKSWPRKDPRPHRHANGMATALAHLTKYNKYCFSIQFYGIIRAAATPLIRALHIIPVHV
jgi:hypothetical protein